jgi:lysozyme
MSSRKRAAGLTGAAAALAVAIVGAHEGLRLNAYRDIVGVPTVCYGETKGVRMGDRYTKQQCDEMFIRRLNEFAARVDGCITRPMPDKVKVAFVGLAYNIGWGGFCKSSIARRWNAGDQRGACDAFSLYNRAGGRVINGLVKRRAEERKLCLQGVANA